MDAKLLLQRNTTIHSFCKFMGRQKTSSSSSDFMTRSSDSHKVHKLSNNQTVYNDNWFDRLAISHLSHAIQAKTGIKSKRKGYDGLLEACRALSQDLNALQQREVAIEILRKAFPIQIIFLASLYSLVLVYLGI
ncbi:hypothetical protein Nepgr_004224 [Nepenthes gracilis]|uniref:Uncharacterized protein n=1 Tax=Nepenthes gracilis TaxID=150966 RepID=A0AAD3XEY8_NEPGR|nr:hypothetical protein Nepgr_004224 [Nepenthes gracilis]